MLDVQQGTCSIADSPSATVVTVNELVVFWQR